MLMARFPTSARTLMKIALACVAYLSASAAIAKSVPAVTLGTVETVASGRTLVPVLRATLEHELAAATPELRKLKKRYVLDASIEQLRSSSRAKTSTTTCVVSALVRTRDAEVIAVVRGRATAEGARNAPEHTKSEAVRGAARSAVVRLAEALRSRELAR